jgi:hypothetical protein
MACSVSATTNSPYIQSYETVKNRDSDFQLGGENSVENSLSNDALFLGSDNKGLRSRVIVVLSNTFSNVAIIETTRFLAIVGLVCSAVASVLLPALGFAAIAAGACVLKNRAIQLNAKDLQGSDIIVRDTFDQTLARSPSIVSRSSQESDLTRTMLREGFIRSRRETPMGSVKEEHAQEESPRDINEAFFNSLGYRDNLKVEDLHGLLSICYYFLCGKIVDMPKYLTKQGMLSPNSNTKDYFNKNFKDCLDKSSKEFQGSVLLDNQIAAINDQQKPLEKADPSLIMEIVQKLHEKISKEYSKNGSKIEAKHHTDKAKHAGEYITQLKTFEVQKNLSFTEDRN